MAGKAYCPGARLPIGTFVVPGLNFLALPVLVTAGTLLALDLGPPVEVR